MRIFVSGTTTDLGNFPAAVKVQLARLKIEPVEQFHFGVESRTLKQMLQNKITSCDAVICLIGSVFGAAPPNSDRSYTQLEFDLARQFGIKPILFFSSAKCSVPEGKEAPEQRELQKKYVEQIRSTSELIRYEFDNETHLRLLAASIRPRLTWSSRCTSSPGCWKDRG